MILWSLFVLAIEAVLMGFALMIQWTIQAIIGLGRILTLIALALWALVEKVRAHRAERRARGYR